MSDYFKILSIDYGRKRIGLAITDPLRIIVSPYKTIDNSGIDDFIKELKSIILLENVKIIILGCPKENEQNKDIVSEIMNIKSEIEKITGIELKIQDETYTSKNAINRMLEVGKSKKFRKQKANIDSFAAAIILEEYLNENN